GRVARAGRRAAPGWSRCRAQGRWRKAGRAGKRPTRASGAATARRAARQCDHVDMARIPDAFIDDLLARTDIVEVINARVPLKRQGKEYSARCPFHDERSPSFTVSPTKQFYHCFGCGAHGTAISFL